MKQLLITLSLLIFALLPAQEFSQKDLIGQGSKAIYGNGYKLRKEVKESWDALVIAARKEGFRPQVISSFRSYAHQNRIWTRKYNRYRKQGLSHTATINKIIEYSTIPGTSRHHWGTDLDIIDGAKGVAKNPLNAKHFIKGGRYYAFKQWLDANAHKFGFYEVYTNDKDRKGFKYEPWHFSYKPTAIKMLKGYCDLNIGKLLLENNLKGSNYFTVKFIERYIRENVMDINPELLP